MWCWAMKVFQLNSWSTTAIRWGWPREWCGQHQWVSDLPARLNPYSKIMMSDMLTIRLALVILTGIRTRKAPTTFTMLANRWVVLTILLASHLASLLQATSPKAKCKPSLSTQLQIQTSTMRVPPSTRLSSFCRSAWWTHRMMIGSRKLASINWHHPRTRKDSLCCNPRSLSVKPNSTQIILEEATLFLIEHHLSNSRFLKTTKKRPEPWKSCG